MLDIDFDTNGMISASYRVGRGHRLNDSQLEALYLAILGQLEKNYGTYSEIIMLDYRHNNSERYMAWHFHNFHIIVVADDTVQIVYLSDTSWNTVNEQLAAENKFLLHLPNNSL